MEHYIFAGVVWLLGIPYVGYILHDFNKIDEEDKLSWPVMIAVALLWPLFLVIFIIFIAFDFVTEKR